MIRFTSEHLVKFCPRLADSKSARLCKLVTTLAPNPKDITAKQFASLVVVDWLLHLGDFETSELHRSVVFFEPDIESACRQREVWLTLLDGSHLRRTNQSEVLDVASGELINYEKPATMYVLNLTVQLARIVNNASTSTTPT